MLIALVITVKYITKGAGAAIFAAIATGMSIVIRIQNNNKTTLAILLAWFCLRLM